MSDGAANEPSGIGDAEALSLLRELERMLRAHPRLTRAVVSSLVREGRAYAETPAGAQLREDLLRSQRVRRAWVLWDTFGLGRGADDDAGMTPSWWLRAVASLTSTDRLESLVSRHLMGGPAR